MEVALRTGPVPLATAGAAESRATVPLDGPSLTVDADCGEAVAAVLAGATGREGTAAAAAAGELGGSRKVAAPSVTTVDMLKAEDAIFSSVRSPLRQSGAPHNGTPPTGSGSPSSIDITDRLYRSFGKT